MEATVSGISSSVEPGSAGYRTIHSRSSASTKKRTRARAVSRLSRSAICSCSAREGGMLRKVSGGISEGRMISSARVTVSSCPSIRSRWSRMRLRYSSAESSRGSGPPNHALACSGGNATVNTFTSCDSRLCASSMIKRRRLGSCSARQ